MLKRVQNMYSETIYFELNGWHYLWLECRFQIRAAVCETFAPILKLTDMTEKLIKTTCRALTRKYNKDLTAELENEMLHVTTIYSATSPNTLSPLSSVMASIRCSYRAFLEKSVLDWGFSAHCLWLLLEVNGLSAFWIFQEPDSDGQTGKQLNEIIGNRQSVSIWFN